MADEDEAQDVSIYVPEDKAGGVWANMVSVSHSPYEFTLDFVRLDFSGQPPMEGILVQRVSVSPLLVMQLIQALQTNWSKYAEKAMPPEVIAPDE